MKERQSIGISGKLIVELIPESEADIVRLSEMGMSGDVDWRQSFGDASHEDCDHRAVRSRRVEEKRVVSSLQPSKLEFPTIELTRESVRPLRQRELPGGSAPQHRKSVQAVKNSLKFIAQEREGVLTIKVGVQKYSVPVKARMLSGNQYLFLSFPASSELYQVQAKELVPLDKDADASLAYEGLNPGKRGRRRRGGGVELPSNLAEALAALPAGYKLGYTPEGSPKLVRSRRRS